MPNRRRRALGALSSLFLIAAGVPAPAASLEYVGTFVWHDSDDSFGGFSGIELNADGSSFHALTDRAHLYWGSIERDNQGMIRGMNIAGRAHLKDRKGRPLKPGYHGDSEGLAIGEDGRIWISFEGLNRISLYENPDYQAEAPFAAMTIDSINAANTQKASVQDVPYTGGQFVAIPEFQGIGTAVGQQFSAALAGQMSAEDALAAAQSNTTREMTRAGYIK